MTNLEVVRHHLSLDQDLVSAKQMMKELMWQLQTNSSHLIVHNSMQKLLYYTRCIWSQFQFCPLATTGKPKP